MLFPREVWRGFVYGVIVRMYDIFPQKSQTQMFLCMIACKLVSLTVCKTRANMEKNKLCYETPQTESIELRSDGIICQSEPVNTNGNPNFVGFSEEKEW